MKISSKNLYVLQVFLLVCAFSSLPSFIPDKVPRMAVLIFIMLYFGAISGYQLRKREEETNNKKPAIFAIVLLLVILIAFIVCYKLGI